MNNHILVKETPYEFRTLARSALRGIWGKAVLGVIIYELLLAIAPSIFTNLFPSLNYQYSDPSTGYTFLISPVSSLYTILVTGPLGIGYVRYILNILRRKEPNYNLIYSGFAQFIKALVLYLLCALLIWLRTLPFIVLAAFIVMLAPSAIYFGIVVMFVGMILALLQYVLAPYFLADNKELGPIACIKLSKETMMGNKASYTKMILSFIGWMLLVMVISAVLSTSISMYNLASLPYMLTIINIILVIPTSFLMLYVNSASAFFYEIASGKMLKGGGAVNSIHSPEIGW